MSRSRSRSVPASSTIKCATHGYTYYVPATTYGFDGRFDKERIDEIVDDPSPLSVNKFGSVTHSKCIAARILAAERVADFTTHYGNFNIIHNHVTNIAVVPNNPFSYSASPSVDWVSAVVDLADSVNGLIKSKSLIGVTALELSKTVEMVKNPFSLLKPNWRDRVGKMSAKTLAKRNANIWLEYQYGWRAAQYDLQNFATSAGRYAAQCQSPLLNKRSRDYRLGRCVAGTKPTPTMTDALWATRVAAALNYPSPYSYSYPNSCTSDNIRLVFETPRTMIRVGCRWHDVVKTQMSSVLTAISSFGLTGPQILASVWELVPYSFVVDWFVNTSAIGNLTRILTARNTLQQAAVDRLGYSLKTEVDFSVELIASRGYESNYENGCGFKTFPGLKPVVLTGTKGKCATYSRSPGLPSCTMGALLSANLNLSQLTSGVSLLTQFLR